MGCGQIDDTLFLVEDIQPHSFDTTDLIQTMLDDIDFVLHIGDISYARGFSAVVSVGTDCVHVCVLCVTISCSIKTPYSIYNSIPVLCVCHRTYSYAVY